jgi:endonuclease-3
MEAIIIDVLKTLDAMSALYPDVRAELHFSNPYETLISTILAAQCTDVRVNQVTEGLFQCYPDARAMAAADPVELERLIKPCGLYRAKAKNIIAACRALVDQYGGEVPADREKLMALPGVGQKTAGVVLLAAFGEDQIPVDTHVFRLAKRIGLADSDTPTRVEAQLRKAIPQRLWSRAHHLLIWHGRRVCFARKPACDRCPLKTGLCQYVAEGRQG